MLRKKLKVARSKSWYTPVLAIDGPAGAGKGTISKIIAYALKYHYLDSGMLYRILGLEMDRQGIDPSDIKAIVRMARHAKIRVVGERAWVNDHEHTAEIRSQKADQLSKTISPIPGVRQALRKIQRDQQRKPGLVAEGRDMGYLFKDEGVFRFYLDATFDERVRRVCERLSKKGEPHDPKKVREAMSQRDFEDTTRPESPLRRHHKAVYIDSTHMSPDQVANLVIREFRRLRRAA